MPSGNSALIAHIRQMIAANGGWIDFARFMDAALYTPALGYYQRAQSPFGRDGDYLTAPAVSTRFADCLANAIAPLLAEYPPSAAPQVIEIGAGNGILAGDLLSALAIRGHTVHYGIIEKSVPLQQTQRQHLSRHHVSWLTAVPAGFRGILIANEVLDALPVRRLLFSAANVYDIGVSNNGDGDFVLDARPLRNEALLAQAQTIREHIVEHIVVEHIVGHIGEHSGTPDGRADGQSGGRADGRYVTEVCPSLATFITTHCGAAAAAHFFCIDYGYPAQTYYHPQRVNGTFLCYHQHRAHDDALTHIGEQDMTAHVNFTAVCDALTTCGYTVTDFSRQAAFLLAHGLADTPPVDDNDAAAIRRLMMPDHLGEFCVLTACKR